MIVKNIVVGPLESNCFIIGDEISRKAIVIDPGDEPDRILETLQTSGLTLEYIICTHAHFDHVGAVSEIKKETGAGVIIHKDELDLYRAAGDIAASLGYDIGGLPDPDRLVHEGDEISVGTIIFKVLHTPGHSPGGMCLFGKGLVITGDTLFAGSVGRTDFYGGDMDKLKQSFQKLMSLPLETRVLAGHGPDSTVGREKSDNFFSREI